VSSDRTAVEGQRGLRELHREQAKLDRRVEPIQRVGQPTYEKPKGAKS
jgi:hypothetical protein